MFDRYFVQGRPVEHHTTINQKPHDTADAARLYGEMVKQAKEELLGATIRGANADIKVVVLQMDKATNFENLDTELRVMFSINGHNYSFKTTEQTWEREVYRAIGEHIATEVVQKLASKGAL